MRAKYRPSLDLLLNRNFPDLSGSHLRLHLQAENLDTTLDQIHAYPGGFRRHTNGPIISIEQKMGKLLRSEDALDETTIRDLEQVMRDASICGLGQAAPNPIRLTLKHFPDEV